MERISRARELKARRELNSTLLWLRADRYNDGNKVSKSMVTGEKSGAGEFTRSEA